MAYVAVKGGSAAIEQSIHLLSTFSQGENAVSVKEIMQSMPLLIDKVISEAGLYAPEYAALALKQSYGSVEEAVFLLRAYRSTLKREYYSLPVDAADMRLTRRISASFKDVPGGQILGATFDYSHRLLDFGLLEEEGEKLMPNPAETAEDIHCARVDELFHREGILQKAEEDNGEPFDITSNVMTFPAPRSARLQTLTRSEEGFLGGVSYSAMRGYGAVHPTVSELRCGYLEIEIIYPLSEGETMCIGEILATEVEALWPSHAETDEEFKEMTLSGGYGMVFGRNENKAIAMAIADASLNTVGTSPSQDEEFVLTHGDCLEMSGFISHLKLPHYVTFQSKLDRVRREEAEND